MDSAPAKAPRRGRPTRSQIDLIRCQVWVGEVQRQYLGTWRELERFVGLRLGDWREGGFTSRWNKYARGATTPGVGDSARRLTTIVESLLPQTESIYWHPFWRALQFDKPLTRNELFSLYAQLPTEIAQAIMQKTPSARFWRRPTADIAWRHIEYGHSLIDRLGAALLLCRDAELSQDSGLFTNASAILSGLLDEMKGEELFSQHWPNVISLVNARLG